MKHGAGPTRRSLSCLPWAYFLLLLALGIYVCREAFYTESTGHFNSMHGEWMALARLAGMDRLGPRWWPYWGGGAPIDWAYPPLIPFLIAAISRLFHCSTGAALNALLGAVWCAGPLTLFAGAWRLSKAPGYAFIAALVYAVAFPPEYLDASRAFGLAWFATTRRAYRLFDWDDLPHLACLVLLPLAVCLLARALRTRRPLDFALAAAPLAAMMTANMFGLPLAFLIVATVPLALEQRFRPDLLLRAGLVGAGAYLIASPWAPPSLLLAIRAESAFDGADWSWRGYMAIGIVLAAWWLTWRLSRRLREWPLRWIALFACPVTAIAALDHYLNLHCFPQPQRYQIEMEWALALALVFALRSPIQRIPPRARALLALPLLLLAARQTVAQRQFVKRMLAPVDVARSIEYRASKWVGEHFADQRVLMPGSIAEWMNVFNETPQMSGQNYNTAPNWTLMTSMYAVFYFEKTGGRDAEMSTLWMKAFGAQAVAVTGPRSPEYWKPFVNPRQFEGVLPVLWREDDTTIYRVPQTTASLAHVMRPESLTQHKPPDGLHVNEVSKYVAALEDPAAPPASFEWRGPNQAVARARLEAGQVVSVQVNYAPGWRARVRGSERRVRADGLGLMAIEPQCVGECEIALQYDGGWEAKACRSASAGLLLLMAGWAVAWRRRARADACFPRESMR